MPVHSCFILLCFIFFPRPLRFLSEPLSPPTSHGWLLPPEWWECPPVQWAMTGPRWDRPQRLQSTEQVIDSRHRGRWDSLSVSQREGRKEEEAAVQMKTRLCHLQLSTLATGANATVGHICPGRGGPYCLPSAALQRPERGWWWRGEWEGLGATPPCPESAHFKP